ncbi:MAG: DUF4260 domain-containing protein [Chlamydiales bacterium]|nr:DUF4260 domain-containing protein [Chlamydiales bacterium]
MEFFKKHNSGKGVIAILRLEGLALFLASLYLFHYLHGSWLLFIILFFVADIGLLGYFLGVTIGTISYNLTHTEVFPIILATLGLMLHIPLLLFIGIIWFSHINFDRLLGLGLKHSDNWKHTHLRSHI